MGSHTFTTPGSYSYICSVDPDMQALGRGRRSGGGTPLPTTSAPPTRGAVTPSANGQHEAEREDAYAPAKLDCGTRNRSSPARGDDPNPGDGLDQHD